MISAFYLAVSINRVFLVEHTHPFPLNHTPIPNVVEWDAVAPISAQLTSADVQLIDSQDPHGVLNDIKKLHDANVALIRLRINRYWLGMLLWSNKYKSSVNTGIPGSLYREFIHERVSDRCIVLRAGHMESELQLRVTEPFVGIHIRIVGNSKSSPGLIR